jgi:hypothetical protein
VPVADQQFDKLAKAWKVTSVTLGGVDKKTLLYPNFVLNITGTKGATSFIYTTTGNPPSGSSWKGSGTWAFGTDPLTMLIREPGTGASSENLAMSYTVTETTLQISFTLAPGFTPYANQGRTEVVEGNWIFTFGL